MAIGKQDKLWAGAFVGMMAAGTAAAFWWISTAETRLCRETIKAGLKAPTSYRELSRLAYDGADGRTVSFEFVSDNSFGAALRGKGWCKFGKDSGAMRSAWIDGVRFR